MRKFPVLAFATLLYACNTAGDDSAHAGPPAPAEAPDITIEVAGAPAGQAQLIALFGDQNYRLDSAAIDEAGKVVFQRDTPYPAGLLFLLLPDQSYFQFLVDADQTFTMTTRAGELVGAMQVEGSLDNQLLYDDLRFEGEIQPRFQEVAMRLQLAKPGTPAYEEIQGQQEQLLAERKKYLDALFRKHPRTFFTSFKKAGQNPEIQEVFLPDGSPDMKRQIYLYRIQLWDNVDFSDPRLLRTPVIINKLKRYMQELTPQHPDSINQAAAYLLDQVLDYPEYFKFLANQIALNYEPTNTTLMDSEAVFVFMVQNYFTYERAFWADSAQVYALQLRAQEMAASLVGKKGPDVRAQDPAGNMRAISDITTPYVIVFLYNPECDHCIEETPKLVNFYREWKSKGVEVYAIALDTEEAEWRDFIAKNSMTWINVMDPSNRAFYGKYFVDNTPEIYVLNAGRTIIGKNLKVSQIEEVIRRDGREGG